MTAEHTTTQSPTAHRRVAVLVVCALSLSLLVTVVPGTAAAGPEPDLQCVGSGGGTVYETDSGLRIFENHTATGNEFYFPSTDTVRFNYSTGGVNLSSPSGTARLENVTDGTVCLGGIIGGLTAQPDGGAGIQLTATGIDIAFGDPVFESGDAGVDVVYDVTTGSETTGPVLLTLLDTGLDEGQTVGAYDTAGTELSNATVAADGSVTLGLPSTSQPFEVDFVAESDGDTDGSDSDDSDTGGGGGGGGGSSSSGGPVLEVTASEDVGQSDPTTETDSETDGETDSEVRRSTASGSVTAGSTLSIVLPDTSEDPTDDSTEQPTDEAVQDPDEQPPNEQADDEPTAEEGTEDGTTEDSTEGTATTGPVERPPPVSQPEVESVEIDVSENVDAEVEITQSRNPPREDAAEFQRDDGTQAAGYIEVTDNLDDEQVTEGRISFRINKADLETDDAEAENVALYHYVPETGEWEELDTQIVGETDSTVRFRGTTDGFSQFATGIKRAQFEISDALVDVQEVTIGDSIQVEAIVTNTGGADGTFTAQLLVGGDIVAEDVLTIASGGQRATIFDHEFGQADTYEVRVNDVSTGEIQVTDPNAASAGSTDSFLPGFGFGTAAITLVVSALLYRRRAA